VQAMDESGNASAPGVFYVTLMDDEDPQLTATCPPAAETIMDDASCDYNSDPSLLGMPTAIAVDDCDVNPMMEMTYVDNIVEATCGNGFVLDRTWTTMAIDHCNNYSTEVCHQIITVLDTTAPSLGLSEPLVIPCPGGSVDSVLAAWGEENSLLDGCETLSEVEFVWDYDSPLDCADVDPSSSIGLTLSDGCGNASQYEAQLVPVGGFACGQPWTFDGHDYATVEIGDQCWFAENLRTTVYANGDVIPAALTDGEWTSTTAGATAVYGEGSSGCESYSPDIDACDEAESLAAYGRLYNWYAVDDARGLCPVGWHVPTDGEWTELEDIIASQGYAGAEGTAMKSTGGWYSGVNGTDDFGFSALPGGLRFADDGYFGNAGYYGLWWSSSPNGGNAWLRGLYDDNPVIYRFNDNPRGGFYVRCFRDAE
ncbi:MAG: fibrobacter succinogenes major paralogous domain-containing protein, partial [Flavobacteriales bacterium]